MIYDGIYTLKPNLTEKDTVKWCEWGIITKKNDFMPITAPVYKPPPENNSEISEEKQETAIHQQKSEEVIWCSWSL